MVQKLTIEEVKKNAKEMGVWEVLDTKYVNCSTKLNCKCIRKGHLYKISWDFIQRGIGCVICYNEDFRGSFTKLTIEEIKYRSKEIGQWEILDNTYDGAHQKLNCKCLICGHIHKIRWSCIQQKVGCPKCYNKIRGKTLKLSIDEVKKLNEKIGNWIILSDIYETAHKKLKCKCVVCGYLHEVRWSCIQQGQACPICKAKECSKRVSGKGHPQYGKVGSLSATWKGGISKKPYCQDWSKDLKEFIKERDGYKCMNPNCSSKNPGDLTVHHINYNKKSCGPENLITVCRSCNGRANKDRNWHEYWYKAILYRRYNYIY